MNREILYFFGQKSALKLTVSLAYKRRAIVKDTTPYQTQDSMMRGVPMVREGRDS